LLLEFSPRDEGEEEEGEEYEEGGDERRIIRMLLGSRMLRCRKLRRLALAHLLRERAAHVWMRSGDRHRIVLQGCLSPDLLSGEPWPFLRGWQLHGQVPRVPQALRCASDIRHR